MEKTLKLIENSVLYLIVFLVPLFVLPAFPNVYITSKLTLLGFGILAILILKIIRILVTSKLSMHVGTYDIPLIALAATYIASLIIRTPNKIEGLLLPGSASIIVFSVFIYFLVSQLENKPKQIVKLVLIGTGVVAALISLLSITGIFKSMAGLPAFMKEPSFNPIEGNIQALIFLLALVPLIIQILIQSKDTAVKTLVGTSAAIVVFGIIVCTLNLLPNKTTTLALPGFSTSWEIALDSVKQSPLFGMGPGNYLTAFNRFRPANYNLTDLWQIRFTNGRNFYLTVMTEVGLLGLFVVLLLLLNLFKIIRQVIRDKTLLATSLQGSIIVLLLLIAVFPASLSVLLLLFVLLGLSATTHKVEYEAKGHSWVHKLPVVLATLPVLIGIIVFGYFATRVLAAEVQYRDALTSVAKNDGRASYDNLRAAIVTNPYVDRYRASYAQVNLALANNIAGKKDLTDTDKQTITTLVQQAIREGKATVVLNPSRAGNWELLSTIYRSVIPLAKGADQFAVQTGTQAAILDPTNPNLRIYVGGLYYSLKNYDAAVENFKMAASLKPDMPNAYYNLAIAYREKGDLDRAIAAMKAVVNLLEKDKDKNSKDYELAKTELDNLEKKKPSTPGSSDNLNPAGQTSPAPTLNPKIDLPSDANPPEAPADEVVATPTPTPLALPTPLATPLATPVATPQ